MKASAFSRLGHSVLAATLLTVFTQVSSFGQSMATAKPVESLAALETAIYQIPETTKFKVHFVNPSGHKITVQLRNASDEVVYSETVSDKNYIRKFDLENLTDGMYHFDIVDGKQHIRKEVEIQTVSARSVQVQ